MFELITGLVLATAAGLNAYIPLLGLGLLTKFTDIVQLPDAWAWLANDWTLIVLGVLLAVEFLVDKFPVLDTFNDVLQTVVRPASGGIVFAAGVGSETLAVSAPDELFRAESLWPILIGILIALVPHLLKALVRPALNAITGGAGAVIASTAEDVGAVLLTVLAVVVPILALVLMLVMLWWLVRRVRRVFEQRREHRAAAAQFE